MNLLRFLLVILSATFLAGISVAQENRMQQIVPPEVKIVASAQLPTLQVNELVSAQPVQSASITISQTRLQKGGKSPHHNHPEEELIVVISGLLRVMSPDGEYTAGPGDVVVVESYAEHQFEALEDTFMVEGFGPGRLIGAPPPLE